MKTVIWSIRTRQNGLHETEVKHDLKRRQNEKKNSQAHLWLADTPPFCFRDESKQYEDSGQTNVNDQNVNVMFGIPIK